LPDLIITGREQKSVSAFMYWLSNCDKMRLSVQALEAHVDAHAPHGAKVTFRLLGFKAHPYSMPKDTIVNKAAAKVNV